MFIVQASAVHMKINYVVQLKPRITECIEYGALREKLD